jgi:hypothetical protein
MSSVGFSLPNLLKKLKHNISNEQWHTLLTVAPVCEYYPECCHKNGKIEVSSQTVTLQIKEGHAEDAAP